MKNTSKNGIYWKNSSLMHPLMRLMNVQVKSKTQFSYTFKTNLLDNCDTENYMTSLRFYTLKDGLQYFKNITEYENTQILIIYYESTDVFHYQTAPILSIWEFISQCGGSLGLFLGFSFYNSLIFLRDFLRQKLSH